MVLQWYSITTLNLQFITSLVTYIARYHFIAISTSYLNAPGFCDSFFNSCNITDYVYIGRRRVGWEVGAYGEPKAW